MSPSSVLWLVGGAVAVVWVIAAQARTRPIRCTAPVAVLVARWVLLAYGVLLVVLVVRSQAAEHPLHPPSVLLLLLMGALAVGFGILRGAATVLRRTDDGQVCGRGGVPVILLWVVSLGVHLALDWQVDQHSGIAGLGAVTTLGYLVLTVAAQNATVRHRAAATLRAEPGTDAGPPAR